MKLAAVLFFVLLAYMHQVCGLVQSLHQPLSAFRYGEQRLLGYAVFCAIALVGAIYISSLRQFEEPAEVVDITSFGVLLAMVVITPSWWTLHEASAIVLLASVYAYFGVLLYRSQRYVLMVLHLLVPILLTVVTRFQSYGIWQKSTICYFIVALVIHQDILKRGSLARHAAIAETESKAYEACASR
jgi:hypothetical protein